MYSESDLEAAVAAGALSPDAATALRNHVAQHRSTPMVDEEHFRLITGFNDIFVGVAALLLLSAIAWIGTEIPPHIGGDGPSPVAPLLVAGTAWGLAEFFTRRRRMALPSIILLLAFIGGVFATCLLTGALTVMEIFRPAGAPFGDYDLETVIGETTARTSAAIVIALSAVVTVAATWQHWRRFRVPITVAAGVAAVAAAVLGIVAVSIPEDQPRETVLLTLGLLLGIGTFLLAMWWDSSDPRRETRRSDVAFWLHLLSAPLMVHPIFSLLGLNDGNATVAEAVVVLVVYALLGLTALAIDRRALLVSALAYVLWALSDLFERFGAVELNVALTALVIGSALLVLSAFWHNVRRAIVQPLPEGLRAKLPVADRIALAA